MPQHQKKKRIEEIIREAAAAVDFSFSGKAQSRRVKVRRDGFKNAGTLVKQLLGKSEG